MKIRLTEDLALLEEAGDPHTVTVFGIDVGFEPVDADHLSDDVKETLRGNRFFVCDGGPLDHDKDGKKGGAKRKTPKAAEPAPAAEETEDDERSELIAQLEGLEIEFSADASNQELEALLESATAPAA